MLKDQGWTCARTEHWNPFAHIRQDLFGFVDILAIKNDQMLAVQTTTNDNAAARIKKIKENPNYEKLKATGCRIEVHGWALKGESGKRKIWECRIIKKI